MKNICLLEISNLISALFKSFSRIFSGLFELIYKYLSLDLFLYYTSADDNGSLEIDDLSNDDSSIILIGSKGNLYIKLRY